MRQTPRRTAADWCSNQSKRIEKSKKIKQQSKQDRSATISKSQCGIKVEERDGEQNFDMSNNGAIIPTTIANRVISTVKEMCPILNGATMYM